ncbi:DUF7563 family protein [Halobellus rufus]|uniref:DUF7563 family protein n=1 Tax=Halobellus rufus TaxID=1448860 RepID=UPI0018CFED3D|nr:hypothetical protein [Halobellus rufus]
MPDRRYTMDTNRQCERCGAAVSKQFVRVFGFDNTVHGCLNCLTRTELAVGKAANRTGAEEEEADAGIRWPTGSTP